MAEHKPHTAAPWRRADRGADALVLASWLLLIGLGVILTRPPALPETAHTGTVAVVEEPVMVNAGPDFYPYVRPGSPAPTQAGVQPWAPKPKPNRGGFLTRLNAPGNDPVFFASSHGNADSFYGGDWKPENIAPRNGGAFLEVRREQSGGLPYTAAEMQSSETFRYGRYETVMQPARGSGLVTAFFTYTGPWFGDPHDEIDIEFLGSDTTRIHFNYFRNGKSIKPATFDLPFDAASKPHLYAFEWRPDGITWFVEGVPIYATEAGDAAIPVTASKVMFSAWTGKPMMAGWHGKPVFRDGSGAQFNCVSFTPLGHDTPKCSDTYRGGAGASSAGAR
ncbi:MAG: family 16 glycosylhydrolase [Hyphomonas sp.]